MDMVYKFLSEHSYLIDYFVFIVYLVFSVLLFRKTGNINYLKEVLEEVKHKYKTEQTVQTAPGQVFPRFMPVYRLNKATNELEQTDEFLDIDELVNSSKNVTLDAILDRYLPVEQSDIIQDNYVNMLDDIDLMQELNEKANYYKEKLSLDPSLSISDVFKAVKNKSEELKSAIDIANKLKGGNQDEEKKIDEKSE